MKVKAKFKKLQNITNKKMNISQIAKQTHLSAKQIRDYESIGLLNLVNRSSSGYRVYDDSHVKRLQFIHQARQMDFSLAEIAQLLALQDDPNRYSRDVKTLTAKHITQLDQQIENLQKMRKTLQVWHDNCRGDDNADCHILQKLTEH